MLVEYKYVKFYFWCVKIIFFNKCILKCIGIIILMVLFLKLMNEIFENKKKIIGLKYIYLFFVKVYCF